MNTALTSDTNIIDFTIDDYDELQQAIYEAPMEENPWSRFLTLLQEKMPDTASIVVFRKPRPERNDPGFIVYTHEDHDAASDYNNTYWEMDPFFDLPRGKCLSIYDVVDRHSFQQSDYYKGFIEPIEIVDIIGIDVEHESTDICLSFRSAMFEPGKGFTQQHKDILMRLAPHILRAAKLHKLVLTAHAAHRFFSDYISSLDSSAIAIDDTAKVLSCNERATALIEQHDCFRLDRGHFKLKSRSEQKKLMDLIEWVTANKSVAPRGLFLPNLSVPSIFVLRYVPMSGQATYSKPAVFMTIHTNSGQPITRKELLMELFDLTKAECKVAAAMITGKDPKEIAQDNGVSINTIRSQIQSLLLKTGTNRQGELINLLWNILT
ncbi:Uncharacterised protein [BD1-7 clade bacterium]|uniref:HTH luxR-type domain-containing protein n=1 Tax=BD1-7 clade bacterium TaxID=2029982 RepID=A0A5S9NN86_9GAMM|nr:Uncharacterised protein [BD1-7 clade bacterium]